MENQFCTRCGAALVGQALAPYRSAGLTISRRQLPALPLQRVGRAAVAVGLTALAAEAGLAWLRRRLQRARAVTVIKPEKNEPPSRSIVRRATDRGMTVVTQRVTQVWQGGRLRETIEEQTVWQREES